MIVTLDRLAAEFAVARLAPGSGWPHWATWSREFVSVSRTRAETSVICEAQYVPATVPAERGFAAYVVRGPLPFSLVGVMAAITAPLAAAAIPLLAVSTYDTDVILVRRDHATSAEQAWDASGIEIGSR